MSEQLHDLTVGAFLASLASDAPTPGGGSVAALSGAMAASLLSMVCAITLGKAKQQEDPEELRAIHTQAEALRSELQRLAQDDIAVFGRLSAAYKLPRTTQADAATRRDAIQEVTRLATEVPLRIAYAGVALLHLCTALVGRTGRLLVSDVGVAAALARATVQSALLNVEINLTGLDDAIYVRETRAQMEDLTVGVTDETRGVLELVRARIHQ